MFCTKCGATVHSDWAFCAQCGAIILTVSEARGRAKEERQDSDDTAIGGVETIQDSDELRTDGVQSKQEAGTSTSVHVIDVDGATGRSAAAASYFATESEDDYVQDNCADILDPDSEEIEEHELVTMGETNEFQIVLEQSDYNEVLNSLLAKREEFKEIKITVAISGAVGSGKSSLINALMGLKDGEKGAATTSPVEETTEPTCYSLPNNPNMELWDLPGVGSQNFPKKNYVKNVHLMTYDLIILASSSAFTALDAWLATQIMHTPAYTKLFFVRTRVDDALRSKETGRGKSLTDEEKQKVMETIKEDCLRNLAKKDILDPNIFLVNNHNIHEFDFGEFSKMLITQVSARKRESLILSLHALTREIVPLKVETLRKRIAQISKQAAMAAVISKRVTESSSSELEILKKEVGMYIQQLAVDKKSVEALAHLFAVSSDALLSSNAILTTRIEQYWKNYTKKRETEVPSIWYELPLVGKWLELRKYQKQSYFLLNTVLNRCVRDNRDIFSLIGNLIRQKTKPKSDRVA